MEEKFLDSSQNSPVKKVHYVLNIYIKWLSGQIHSHLVKDIIKSWMLTDVSSIDVREGGKMLDENKMCISRRSSTGIVN